MLGVDVPTTMTAHSSNITIGEVVPKAVPQDAALVVSSSGDQVSSEYAAVKEATAAGHIVTTFAGARVPPANVRLLPDGRLKQALCQAYLQDASLVSLQHESVSVPSARLVAQCLLACPAIQRMYLTEASLGPAGTRLVADAICGCNQLAQLCLAGNAIGAVGAACVGQMLRRNKSLTRLNLGRNELGAAGLEELMHGLEGNTTLGALELSENQLGVSGGKLLPELFKNRTLTHLGLEHNELGPSGGRFVAQALQGNISLESIGLAGNGIQPESGVTIVQAISATAGSALGMIEMAGNKIGDAGCTAFCELLKTNTAIRYLGLDANGITEEGSAAILDSLKHNTTLRQVSLAGNLVGATVLQGIANGLHYPRTNAMGNTRAPNDAPPPRPRSEPSRPGRAPGSS
jgi:hypothetical protein